MMRTRLPGGIFAGAYCRRTPTPFFAFTDLPLQARGNSRSAGINMRHAACWRFAREHGVTAAQQRRSAGAPAAGERHSRSLFEQASQRTAPPNLPISGHLPPSLPHVLPYSRTFSSDDNRSAFVDIPLFSHTAFISASGNMDIATDRKFRDRAPQAYRFPKRS